MRSPKHPASLKCGAVGGLLLLISGVGVAPGAHADGVVGPIGFSIPSEDQKATLTGDLSLPGGAACTDKKKLPVVLLVPGSGEFDRDEDFGTSNTEKDLLFKQLAWDLNSEGVAVVRFDYRGVRCNRFSLPTGAQTTREKFLKRCVDLDVRETASPDAMRSDLKQVYDYALKQPCIDAKNFVVLAHSEGSFHVARLIHDKAIAPKALVFIGGVAESPKSLVQWQAIDRVLARYMRAASAPDRITNAELKAVGAPASEDSPKGYWTRAELEGTLKKRYEDSRAKAMAEPDTKMYRDFWPMSWWKMWWSDDTRVIDELAGYPGQIIAYAGDADTQVPADKEFDLFRAAKFAVEPKLILEPGLGHSLGKDQLKGPMDPEALSRVASDVAKLCGTKAGEILPYLAPEDVAAKPYFGITFELSEPLPKSPRYKSELGLKIKSVLPALPAWDAGLRPGDILVAMDGQEIGAAPKDDALVHFIKHVQALKPGTTANLLVLRWKPEIQALRDGAKADAPDPMASVRPAELALGTEFGKELDLKLSKSFDLLDLKIAAQLPRKIEQPAPSAHNEVETLTEQLVSQNHFERQYTDLRKRIIEVTERPDPFRLAKVDQIQHDPLTIGDEAKRLVTAAVSVPLERFPAFSVLRESLKLIRSGAKPLEELPALKTGLSPDEHVAQIRKLLEDADTLWKQAFQALKPADIDFLRANLPALARKFEEWNYVYADGDTARLIRNETVIDLLSKVDLEPLIRAAASLARLGDPVYVRGLKRDLARAGKDLTQHEILSAPTPYGLIVVGGTGDDDYRDLDKRGVAVLIDLGGNDYYGNAVGSSNEKIHNAVVVDLEGNDVYESNADYVQGSGLLGVGILADLGGNDEYTGVNGVQGTGLGGVGLLIDGAGNDTYRAHGLSQGMGFFGVGALIDLTGDDRYDSRILSQAVGVGGGVGALIDLEGDDEYYAKGYQISGYGTPGTYEGWSQGIGVGLRNLASGGVGLLYDGGGSDHMEGGDFSQGGGYYFGWGILDAAGSGDDTYIGSRYSQGFSAHYALGTFIEEGGNDFYDTRGAVSTGNANDMSVSWFEDDAGNDRYPAQGFSLGASANNAISVFLDRGGNDRFVGTELPANGQVNDYHGGSSYSLFQLSGRGSRSFEKEPPRPLQVLPGFGFVQTGSDDQSSKRSPK